MVEWRPSTRPRSAICLSCWTRLVLFRSKATVERSPDNSRMLSATVPASPIPKNNSRGRDMTDIRKVKLELLRSGPAHNQLLSPLTPYLALCGADGPVTVNMPFEHRQLLSRLDRLRYATNGSAIAASQQEAELREMGEAIGRVLGEVPALLCELSNARTDGRRLR